MIVDTNNNKLTKIFIVVLSACAAMFLISSIAIPVGKASRHSKRKIGCEIISKSSTSSYISLKYKIQNRNPVDIYSFKINTKVYHNEKASGRFETDFNNTVYAKDTNTFEVKVANNYVAYSALYTYNLSSLNFEFYLEEVYFADGVFKTNLDYEMGGIK